MKCGIITLGDHLPNPLTGEYEDTQAERHQLWVELGVAGERLGFDALWLGEHHFNDYILSTPHMVLAAVAARTSRIRLGTAVTLLAHHDPVLIAEQFATLDLLSNGRAEIGFSSGLTPETYRLFGQNQDDAISIQNEKIGLLLRLWNEDEVHWEGKHRAPFPGGRVEPRTRTGKAIPVCIGTGSAERVEKLARDGHKLMLPTVFGTYEMFRDVATLYRETYAAAGHDPAGMEVMAPCYVHVRDDGKDAWEFWLPYLANYREFIKGLAKRQKLTRRVLDLQKAMIAAAGVGGFRRDCDIAGTPGEVIGQLDAINQAAGGIDTLMCYFDCGGMPAQEVIASMELFSRKVLPFVSKKFCPE